MDSFPVKRRRGTIGGRCPPAPAPSTASAFIEDPSGPIWYELFGGASPQYVSHRVLQGGERKREESTNRPSSPSPPVIRDQEVALNKNGKRSLHPGLLKLWDAAQVREILARATAENNKKEEEKKKKKARTTTTTGDHIKKRNVAAARPRVDYHKPTPSWVLELFRGLGARDQYLKVMSKRLTGSDISKDQNRLLLPREAVTRSSVLDALTEDEGSRLETGEGLRVVAVDGNGGEFELTMKYLGSNKAYRLIGRQWQAFLKANDIEEETKEAVATVHLCLFHAPAGSSNEEQQLRLGIVKDRGIDIE